MDDVMFYRQRFFCRGFSGRTKWKLPTHISHASQCKVLCWTRGLSKRLSMTFLPGTQHVMHGTDGELRVRIQGEQQVWCLPAVLLKIMNSWLTFEPFHPSSIIKSRWLWESHSGPQTTNKGLFSGIGVFFHLSNLKANNLNINKKKENLLDLLKIHTYSHL